MKILVTLDGSPASTEVIPFAEELAREARASLILFTVAKPGEGTYRSAEASSADSVLGAPNLPVGSVVAGADIQPLETRDQASAAIEGEATSYLAGLAAPLKEKGLAVETRVAIADDITGAILAAARAENVSLIAMATHGRSGLRAVVQGSVANEVVRAGEFPVLLVRPGSKRA